METIKATLQPQRLEAQFSVDGADRENRTVPMTFYTGAKVLQFSWENGVHQLTLSMEPGHVRLGQLKSGRAPFTLGHADPDDPLATLGVILDPSIGDGKAQASVRFSKRPDVDPILNDILDGILPNVSVGARLHKVKETTKEGDRMKSFVATDWEPFAVALVGIGADPGAHFNAAAQEQAVECEIEFAARATAQTVEEEPDMPETQNTGTEAREVDTQAATLAERTRVMELTKMGQQHGFAELAAQHVESGTTAEAFTPILLSAIAERAAKQPPTQGHRAELTEDQRDKRRVAMTTALLHRYDGSTKLEGEAREYRGMSLLRMAEDCLSNAGVKTRGMSPLELATEALAFGQQFSGVGGEGVARLGMMSTSDFPYILANVANKTLRQAYDAAPSRWREFCRQSNARDFKAKYVNQLGDAPNLDIVPESGEFNTGSIPEAQESYRIYTYGKILPFTRQSLINDDLGAFTRLQELQGRAAARKESDIVWALITANPAMGDGTNLFDAAHGNLVNPGTAISIDNLGIGRKLMRVQKGLGSTEYLNLTPKYLLVPAAKEQLALQFTSANYVAAQGSNINPWAGSITPIAEARLDGSSVTAWYLVADPGQVDTIEYAYLEGQEGVYLETRMGFNVDGMEFKCRLDFGAKVIDWRAFVKNLGA